MTDWFECVGELEKPIVIYPIAIRALGGHAEAAFAAQLRYWMDRCSNPDKWVYKTAKDWEKELCLTPRQQEYVRDNLKKLGVLETYYEREKHLLYYKLKKDVFNTLFEANKALPKNVEAPQQSQKEGQPLPKNVVGTPKKRSSFNTESTAERTTEITPTTEVKPSTKTLKTEANYKTFQSRYYNLVGTTPKKYTSLVKKYEELCGDYGEERVLDCLSEWVDSSGGKKKLFREEYGPNNFLNDSAEIMLTTTRKGDTDDKEAKYPHGLVAPQWAIDHAKKFQRKPEE